MPCRDRHAELPSTDAPDAPDYTSMRMCMHAVTSPAVPLDCDLNTEAFTAVSGPGTVRHLNQAGSRPSLPGGLCRARQSGWAILWRLSILHAYNRSLVKRYEYGYNAAQRLQLLRIVHKRKRPHAPTFKLYLTCTCLPAPASLAGLASFSSPTTSWRLPPRRQSSA